MVMISRPVNWFVETINDPDANESIAKYLDEIGFLFKGVLKDKTNGEHQVFELSEYRLVTVIRSGAAKFGWKIKIWKKRPGQRWAEPWVFGTAKDRKRIRNKRLHERIEAIKERH